MWSRALWTGWLAALLAKAPVLPDLRWSVATFHFDPASFSWSRVAAFDPPAEQLPVPFVILARSGESRDDALERYLTNPTNRERWEEAGRHHVVFIRRRESGS